MSNNTLGLSKKDNCPIPMRITQNRQRLDLTEWVIHFVHDRKTDNDTVGLYEDYLLFKDELSGTQNEELREDYFRMPDYFDENGKRVNIFSSYEENEYEIDEEAYAIDVLKKILHDGFIHSGWSLRNMVSTVYGPYSAVCFTEMPLYALVEYAKVRGEKDGYVGNYGIAFRRNELFDAGARPVIYGLSSEYKETDVDENGVCQGRLLHPDCGIGKHEQYRYVSTSLHKKNGRTIDWTHEREWRWPLQDSHYDVPGIPFFLSKDYADFFTDVIIIVGTDEEMEDVLLHLKTLYDAGSTDTGREYNRSIIASARVLSLETVSKLKNIDYHTMKIENLPMRQMKIMPTFKVSPELLEKVKRAVKEAGRIAVCSVDKYLKENPGFDENVGEWGWAHIITYEVSEVTQALQDAELATTYSDGIYYIKVDEYRTSNLEFLKTGAQAAADYLTNVLGQKFFVKTKLD